MSECAFISSNASGGSKISENLMLLNDEKVVV